MTIFTKEIIQEKIATDLRWLHRSIEVVYENQTATEQQIKGTFQSNGVGFSSCDGKYFSYLATYISNGKTLSGKHLEKAKKVMPKYWKQILFAINENSNRKIENDKYNQVAADMKIYNHYN